MGTPSPEKRLPRRSILAALALFAAPKVVRAWSEGSTLRTKAIELLKNIDFVIVALNNSDAEMYRLLDLVEKPGRASQMLRRAVSMYATDRLARNKNERKMLAELKRLKQWLAPQCETVAETVVQQIEKDAFISGEKRKLAHPQEFLQQMGITIYS